MLDKKGWTSKIWAKEYVFPLSHDLHLTSPPSSTIYNDDGWGKRENNNIIKNDNNNSIWGCFVASGFI